MKHHHMNIDLVINNTMEKIGMDNKIQTIIVIIVVTTKIIDSDKKKKMFLLL
jgi:hypothetical protein